jgi:tape measure domain-containing protein
LNQVRGAGKLMGGDFMQLSQKGIGGLREELAKVSGVAVEDLAKEIESGRVSADELFESFRNLTGQGGLFFSAMKAQSETLEGRLSTLSDEFKALLRVPGDAGLGPAKALVDTLISGTQQATRGASIFVKTLELAGSQGKLGEFLSVSLRLAYAESTLFFLKLMKDAVMTVSDSLGGSIMAALRGDLSGAKEIIKAAFDFSPLGRIRDVLQIDELRKEFGEFTQAGRLAIEQGLNESAEKMKAAMNAGASTVKSGAGELKAAAADLKGAKDALKGDGDGDGIISKREQRKLDLEEKRAQRKANSVKGFSRDKAGLGAFGGLDELAALQFRDGEDGTGFEGRGRAFSAFGGGGRLSAAQVGSRGNSVLTATRGFGAQNRSEAFRGISEAQKTGAVDKTGSSESPSTTALEAILLELRRIRTA